MTGDLAVGATGRFLGALAAWLGSIFGGVAGAGAGLLVAQAAGMTESVADYGWPYRFVLAATLVGAVLGCYLALRLARHALALTTSIILAPLLALPAFLAAVQTESGPGWPTTTELLLDAALYLVLPLASPVTAYLAAEPMARLRRSAWR